MYRTTGSPIFFIKRLLLFLTVPVILVLILEYNLASVSNSYTLKRNCIEKDPAKVEMIILGSSQAHYDINPAAFFKNSCNLANSNQDIYYDHAILSKYINMMPNLKVAFIGISYFSLEFSLENTNEYWRKFFYQRFFDIPPAKPDPLDPRNYSLVASYDPETIRTLAMSGFRNNLLEYNTSVGWYDFPKIKRSQEKNAGQKNAQKHTSFMRPALIPKNTALLEDTISKLQSHGVKVVLITFPATASYYSSVDPVKYENLQKTVGKISEKLQIPYLNYLKDQRFNTDDFADNSDHLNETGSAKFIEIIKQDLKDRQMF